MPRWSSSTIYDLSYGFHLGEREKNRQIYLNMAICRRIHKELFSSVISPGKQEWGWAEGGAGSMQGAWCRSRSQVSRITPWAKGSAKPLSHQGCPVFCYLNGLFWSTKIWILMRPNLSIFFFYGPCFWVISLPNLKSHRSSYIYF